MKMTKKLLGASEIAVVGRINIGSWSSQRLDSFVDIMKACQQWHASHLINVARKGAFRKLEKGFGPGDGEFSLIVTSEGKMTLRTKESDVHVGVSEPKSANGNNLAIFINTLVLDEASFSHLGVGANTMKSDGPGESEQLNKVLLVRGGRVGASCVHDGMKCSL